MAFVDVADAVYSILSNNAPVVALVSTKIYPTIAAQETLAPYVVVDYAVNNEPLDTKTRPSSLDRIRIQVDSYGRTRKQAMTVHLAVRTALDGYTIGSTVAGVLLDGIKFETENEAFDEEIDIFRKSADYIIRVKYS
jgi:hypothetical protein